MSKKNKDKEKQCSPAPRDGWPNGLYFVIAGILAVIVFFLASTNWEVLRQQRNNRQIQVERR